jgi:hypothetical protein
MEEVFADGYSHLIRQRDVDELNERIKEEREFVSDDNWEPYEEQIEGMIPEELLEDEGWFVFIDDVTGKPMVGNGSAEYGLADAMNMLEEYLLAEVKEGR